MRSRAKTIVLMLSKAFPRKHRSAGKKTNFQRSLNEGKKIHTIRSGYEAWKHNIEKIQSGAFYLSLRQWVECSLPKQAGGNKGTQKASRL